MEREIYLIVGNDRIYLGKGHEIVDPANRDDSPAMRTLWRALRYAVADLVFGESEGEVATMTIELK